MSRITLIVMVLIISSVPGVFAQSVSKSLPKAYLGVWIYEGIADKSASCRAITQGGDDDGMLIISADSFRVYLPQVPCKFRKIQFSEDRAISIEANCAGQVLKETWSLNKNVLERRMPKGSQARYVQCPSR